MKQLTQEIVSITCDYLVTVAGLPLTSLELKQHLRDLNYEANQQEVSAMLKQWSRNAGSVITFVTYKQREQVVADPSPDCDCEYCNPTVQITADPDDEECDGDCDNCPEFN